MKKEKKKAQSKGSKILFWSKIAMMAIGVILIIAKMIINDKVGEMVWLNILGVLLIAIAGFLHFGKSEKHSVIKVVLWLLFLVILLSWVIPSGSLATGGTFTANEELSRIGLVHILYGFTLAIQNYSIQISFLLAVGLFYGVISKTEGFKALINRMAKFAKGRVVIVSLIISFVLAFLASFLNNTFVLIAFVPFFVMLLRKIGLDKLGSFVVTFGSIMVGVLGVTFGTETLSNFVMYLGYGGSEVTLTTHLLMRFIVLAIAFIIFGVFEFFYIKKNLKNNESLEEDLFVAEEPVKKNAKSWYMIVLFAVVFIIGILGFIYWNVDGNGTKVFGIEVFEKFHSYLKEIVIGKDELPLITTIFGGTLPNLSYDLAPALGQWYLFNYAVVLVIVALIAAYISHMGWNGFLKNAGEGMMKFAKPILFVTIAYMSFVFIYWNPLIPTIVAEIGKISENFNPFIASIQAAVASFFNTDFAYMGYNLSAYLGSFGGKEGEITLLIYTTIYGLISFVTPASAMLVFGLTYMDIPYKKWLKYIWKFFCAMIVVLLIMFAVLTYI